MDVAGGCYCGALRYQAGGEPVLNVQCHCRECQYITGGHPNILAGMLESGFAYVKGTPRTYRRDDIENPVTREFCAECGTHILTKTPGMPGVVLLKVGTFDDPGLFGGAQIAVYMIDRQSFHHVPDQLTAFERLPD